MAKRRPILYSLFFAFFALLIGTIIVALGLLIGKGQNNDSTQAIANQNRVTLVIDAGHGGEDAGAVASDGTLEKDLNLELASLLCALFELNGTEVKMTRTTDTLLYDHYDDLDDYTGQKKVYDLKNRLKIANECQNPVYVGIHMNKFSASKYSGMQIYYSQSNEESARLAGAIKDTNKLYLQRDNKRQTKKSNGSIYILDNITCPAVLIECGFLSNENELELLKSKEYQARLALVMLASISNFT